jgi:predicted metal-binding membrane protein
MLRFPGRVLSSVSQPTAATLPRRDRLLIASCIATITVLAWIYLVYIERQMAGAMEHEEMMASMGMTMDMPWKIADVFLNFAMWVVMMIGMMAPSASPMLLLFAASRAGRGELGVPAATLAFGLGYVAV